MNRCIINACVCNDLFWKHAVAHERLLIDALTILTLQAKIEFTDEFVTRKVSNDIFLKNEVAMDRLVIDAVTTLTLVE